MNGQDKILDPIDDFVKPINPSYMAPTVPAPDLAMTGGQSIQNLPQGLIPKPAAAPALNPTPAPATAPTATPGPAAPTVEPIRDPLEDILPKATPASQPLGDLLLPKALPITAPPPGPPSRGWMGDVASSISRGLAVRLPEQFGHAIKYFATNPTGLATFEPGSEEQGQVGGFFKELGDSMTDWAAKAPERYPWLAPSTEESASLLRRGVTGTFENAPSSMTPMLAGAIIGSFIPIPGLGTIGGGLIGAGLATMATFGASAYNQAYEDALKAGKTKDEAASIAGKIGWIEGGIEAATDPIEMMTSGFGKLGTGPLKETIRTLLRKPLTKVAKDTLLKTAPIETGTEMLQDWWEAKIQKEAGMPGPEPTEALKEAILPSIGMSILFGIGTHGLNYRIRRQVFDALTNENAPVGERMQAASLVENEIRRLSPPDDKELSTLFAQNAMDDIMAGKRIDLDTDFVTYTQPKPTAPGAPAVPPGNPPSATPAPPTPTPTPEATPPQAPGETPSPVPPSPAPPSPGTPTPPGLVPTPPGPTPTPEVNQPPVIGPNLPQEGLLPKPPVITPGVNPAPQPTPAPPQPAPEKPPVAAPSLGGPEWMKIGGKVEFFDDKTGKMRYGDIKEIVYQGNPPQPASITVSSGFGKQEKSYELRVDDVHEPTQAIRRKEYFQALQGLPAQQRKDAIANAKQFDNFLIKNAELFVEPGYIDLENSTAITDRQKAVATHNILNQARAEAGRILKVQDIYNPLRRAENLQALKDYIEEKNPGGTQAEGKLEAAGNLPMGKKTIFKDGRWWDVSFDEETNSIILKDGERIAVAPDDMVQVEKTRTPKEATPKPTAPEKPAEASGAAIPSPEKKAPGAVAPSAPATPAPEKPVAPPKEEPTQGPAPATPQTAAGEKPQSPQPAPGSEAAPAAAPEKEMSSNEKHTRKNFNEGDTVYFKKGFNKEPLIIDRIGPEGEIFLKQEPTKAWSPGDFSKEPPAAPVPEAPKPPIEAPGKEGTPSPTPEPKPAETFPKPEAALAKLFSDELNFRISKGVEMGITNSDLMEMGAKVFGGTRGEGKFTVRQAYDAMEMGVNKYLQEHRDEVNPAFIEKIMRILPTESVRTEEMKTLQQFSTPPNISYVANWLANVTEQDIFAETSAGNGGLAVFADINRAKGMILNELDKGRVENLKWLFPNARVFNENAEHAADILNPKLNAEEKPMVVVINPPFSASGGRMPGKKILDIVNLHIEQALKLLPQNGRLVVITGRGFTLEAPTFKDFWAKIKADYTVQANVGLDGKNYKKYGTNFDIRMTVIDKTGKTQGEVFSKDFVTTDEMLNDPKLQEIRNGRPTVERIAAGEQVAGKPAVETGFKEGKPEAGQPKPVLGPTTGLVPEPAGPESGKAGIPGPMANPEGKPAEGPTVVAGTQPSGPGIQPGNLPGPGSKQGVQPGRPGEPVTGQPGEQPAGGTQQLRGAKPGELTPPVELTNSVFEFIPDQKHTIDGQELPQHRCDIVESAAHSAVPLPDLSNVKLNLKAKNVGIGTDTVMSGAQMTMIKMAVKAHNQGLGFFNAAGTGFGKGMTNAGIIMNSFLGGQKKAIWFSQNHNLIHSTERDWQAVGGEKAGVLDFSKVKNTEQIEKRLGDKGLLYVTYGLLIKKPDAEGEAKGGKKRIDQLVEWLGPDFDGVIVFDESHKMANAIPDRGNFGKQKPSQTALAGIALQAALPKAKIVYSSATGATTLNHLAYAQGLGIWGEGKPFPNVQEFLNRVAPWGLAGMEVVSAELKMNGVYWSPSLAFQGRTPEKTVTFQTLTHVLTPEQKQTYNTIALQWQKVLNWRDEVMQHTGASMSGNERASQNSRFWGAQLRFFNAMVMSMQLPTVFADGDQKLKDGNSVVIQLVNTGKASQDRAVARMEEEQDLEELDLTPKDILLGYIEDYFPIYKWEQVIDPQTGETFAQLVLDSEKNPVVDEEALARKNQLLADVASIDFPQNTLDQIIDHFGADNVAEVTGRETRFVLKEGKRVEEKGRKDRALQKEVNDFREGKRRVLVFSGKGGTGESYDADYRIQNQQRRIHYAVQAGYSAPQFFQGVGRTHRASQVVAPHYAPVTTDLKGQKRFNSAIAARLEQLGAVTMGQRQTRSEGLVNARDNLDNNQAREALQRFWQDLYNGSVQDISIDEYMKQTGLRLLDKDGNLNQTLPDIRHFLNRMLSMEIDVQNRVFDHFSNLMDRVIDEAAKAGRLDLGIQNLHALKTEILSERIVHTDSETGAKTKYLQIESTHEAKIFTSKAMVGWADSVVRNIKSGKVWAAGKSYTKTQSDGSIERVVPLRSANYTSETIPLKEVNDTKRWSTIPKENVKSEWDKAVDEAPKTFTRKKHLINGAMLPIWDRMSPDGGAIRFQTPDGKRYIGKEILNKDLANTLSNLHAEQDPVKMSPREVYENVMDHNRVVRLANNWKFRRTKTTGEERLEIVGPTQAFNDSMKKMGVVVEYIQFKTRYFLPANPNIAEPIITKLIENRPIMEVLDGKENKIFEIDETTASLGETTRGVGAGVSALPPEWKNALLPEKSYMAIKAVEFLAKNSPVMEDRTLLQAFLSVPGLKNQLEKLPVITFQNQAELSPVSRHLAFYNVNSHSIGLASFAMQERSPAQISGTVVEEITHALTTRNMNTRDKEELDAMMAKAIMSLSNKEKQELKNLGGYRYDPMILKSMGLNKDRVVYYALSKREELLAGAIRYREVREFLKSIPEVEGINKPKNLWDRFVRWMNRVIFGNDNPKNRALLNQVLEKAGELMQKGTTQEETGLRMGGPETNTRFYSIDDAGIPLQMQDNIDALGDPNISGVAASDPGFMAWLKSKMGILNIPKKDLGVIEQYLSLPYYLGKKYPVFQDLLKIQTTREEKRSEGIQQFYQAAQPFFLLKGPEVQKVEQALVQGDMDKVTYDEDTLRERFGLNEAGIQAYNSVRNTLDTLLQRWIDHAEWALLRPFEKRLTGEEYQHLASIYKTALNPEEIAALPPNVAKAYKKLLPNVNLIKRLRSRIGELKGYFPRYREPGKFYITVQRQEEDQNGNTKTVNLFTTFANSEWEVTKIVKDLEANKEFPTDKVIYGRHTQEAEQTFFGTSDQNLQRLIDNAINQVKQDHTIDETTVMEIRTALSSAVAETLMARGAGARMIKRAKTVIAGYQTTGLQQVLKNYIVGYMGMETKQDASFDFLETLPGVPKNQPVLFGEASHYIDSMLRNYDKQDRMFSKFRSLAFIYYLSGAIRSAAVQFTQNFVTGIPFLSREMKGKGLMGAERQYIKAMWDVALGRFQSEDEKFMDHEVLSKGIANDQFIRQISRETRSVLDEKFGKVADLLAAPFSKMEIFNRRAAALAAYRTYKDQEMSFEQRLDKVRDFIYDTHYLMTKANLPHAMRSGDIPSKLLGTAYTFRRFTHNYILSMIYSMRGADGKFDIRKMDVFIRSLAWIAVFGGLSSLPFLDDLLDELEKFFGVPYRAKMREALLSMGGEPLERAGVAGIPALMGQIPGMVGVDLSGSLRIGLPSLSNPAKGASETAFGVWGGLAQQMANAWQSVGRDDYLRAIEFASPAFLQNLLKAQRMATIGATTPQGRVLFDEKGQPIKETAGEGFAQALSFRPERIAKVAEEHREFGNIEANFTQRRNDLYSRFRLAKDADDRQKVIRDVQKYNLDALKYHGAIPMVNAEGLRRSFVSKPEKRYLLWGAQS